jgi:hypothetical protein
VADVGRGSGEPSIDDPTATDREPAALNEPHIIHGKTFLVYADRSGAIRLSVVGIAGADLIAHLYLGRECTASPERMTIWHLVDWISALRRRGVRADLVPPSGRRESAEQVEDEEGLQRRDVVSV